MVRFAERVGRENVVASADCGFSSQATYTPEIHPTVVWAKFEALAEGARLATSLAVALIGPGPGALEALQTGCKARRARWSQTHRPSGGHPCHRSTGS